MDDFHGAPQAVQGLGLMPWSNCVHVNAESAPCSAYRRYLKEGMAPGFAVEDGAALHFADERLSRVVSSRPDARAWRMRLSGDRVSRRPLTTVHLGSPHKAAARLAVVAA